jgi:hypothetical protein
VILIGPELEQTLAAIACCCDIPIEWDVFDRIERESRENQVDSKHYLLHDSQRLRLAATVDAYEPTTAALSIDRGRCKQFNSIIAAASEVGFGNHAYFLERPQKPPQFLAAAIFAAHTEQDPNHPMLRMQLVAIHCPNSITRCFLDRTGLRPTPYLVYATNLRTMNTQQLHGSDVIPYSIKGYR